MLQKTREDANRVKSIFISSSVKNKRELWCLLASSLYTFCLYFMYVKSSTMFARGHPTFPWCFTCLISLQLVVARARSLLLAIVVNVVDVILHGVLFYHLLEELVVNDHAVALLLRALLLLLPVVHDDVLLLGVLLLLLWISAASQVEERVVQRCA